MNRLSLLALFTAGVSLAAGPISRPVAGYATDSSRTQLRTIFGVPGAFGFSDPLPLPDGVAKIRLAPGQQYALVDRAGTSPAILFLSNGTVDRLVPLDGVMSTADWIAFSSGARSALLFASRTNRFQVLSGLPDSPHVLAELDATFLPESPEIGMVSEDGSLVLVASGPALYRLSSGAPQIVLSAPDIRSIALLHSDRDAAVSANDAVQLVRNVAGRPEATILAAGLHDLGTIYRSSDGQSLFAVLSQAGVASIDLATGDVSTFPTSVAAVSLMPLRNRDTFLISARPHQPGWVFYRDGAAGRTVFVPAAGDNGRHIPVKGGVR